MRHHLQTIDHIADAVDLVDGPQHGRPLMFELDLARQRDNAAADLHLDVAGARKP